MGGLSIWNFALKGSGPSAIPHGFVNSQSQCHACPGHQRGPRLRPGQFQCLNPVHGGWSKKGVQNRNRGNLLPRGLTIRSPERTSPGAPSGVMDYKDEEIRGCRRPTCHHAVSQQPHFKLPKSKNSFCLNWIKSVFCRWQQTDP